MLFLVYTVPGLGTALTYRQSDVLKMSTDRIGFVDAMGSLFGIIAAVCYGLICRKFNLRTLLIGSIALNAAVTYLYVFYTDASATPIMAVNGFFGIASELALMDLAVRSTPKGCEALGFALMMSVRNFGISLNDILGTKLIDDFKWSFETLVSVNAATTLAVLLFVPFLPRLIMMRKDGEAAK